MAFAHDGMSILTVSGDFSANPFSPAVAIALVQEWDVVSSNGNKPIAPSLFPGSIVVLSPNKLRQAIYENGLTAVRDQPQNDTKTDILISDTSGKEVFLFKEHSIPITSVSFSPDGRWVISSSIWSRYDSETFIWEADTGKVLWSSRLRPTEDQQVLSQGRFSGASTDPSMKAEFSPNGKWLSLPEDGRRRIVAWPELEDRIVFASEEKVFMSPDSRRLVSFQPRVEAQTLVNEGSSQGTEMKIWDIESSRMLASHFIGNSESGGSANRNGFTQLDYVFFSPDSRFCSPRGSFGMPLSNSVTIYDLSMGNELVRIPVKQELGEGSMTNRFGSNRSLVFSPNGERLMISDSGRQGRGVLPLSVGVWELPSGKLVCRLDGNSFAIQAAVFSPDGKRIATASDRPDKGEVKIWDATTGREMLNLFSKGRARVKSIFFSRDGKQLTLQKNLSFTPAGTPAGPSEPEIVWDVTPRDRSTAPAP